MLNVKRKKNLSWLIGLILFLGLWKGHDFVAKNNELIKNFGISFGWDIWGVGLITTVIVLFLFCLWLKSNDWGMFLIAVGGVINLIDRWSFGYVRDYWRFGTVYNNLADWLIGIGVSLFLIKSLWKKK